MGNKRFNQGEIIRTGAILYKCVLCNRELAVFCKFSSVNTKDGTMVRYSVNYEDNFFVSNDPLLEDNFEFERIN